MLRVLCALAVVATVVYGAPRPAEVFDARSIADKVNSMKTTWKASTNKRFHGVSMDVIRGMMGVANIGMPLGLPVVDPRDVKKVSLPDSFDAREQWPECPSTGDVRDQAACGSCWAFGAVEAITDRICIHSKGASKPYISAQDLVSCCHTCGFGCNGGYPNMAWRWWVSPGIVTGGAYNSNSGCRPYEVEPCDHHVNGTMKPCGSIVKTPGCKSACTVASYGTPYATDKHVGESSYQVANNEEAIRTEIMTNGPVEAGYSVFEDFPSYHSGVYQHVTGKYLGGHAVKILGWGVEDNVPYWLVANSWNTEWGDKGFFKILRGSNECGIERQIVAGMPKM
jgi:cathepsin B